MYFLSFPPRHPLPLSPFVFLSQLARKRRAIRQKIVCRSIRLIARRRHNRGDESHGCRFATGRQARQPTRRAYPTRRDEKFANAANWFTFSRAANSRLFCRLPSCTYLYTRTCTHVLHVCRWCTRASIDFETPVPIPDRDCLHLSV